MAEEPISKRVLFSGVWQSQVLNDQLLQQIGIQNVKKKKKALKGNPSVLNLTSEMLDILIYDKKGKLVRNDRVPITDIIDVAANKNAATCIFTIVRDSVHKNYYIFVFHCASDKDAADILQGFRRIKPKLSGEGYNTDIKPAGNNWTLQQKEVVSETEPQPGHTTVIQTKSTPNGDVKIISTEKEQGETRIVTTTTQATQPPTPKEEVVVTDVEMRDELHQLAGEVRDIKLLLRKSQGRMNFEKHYQYLMRSSAPEAKHVITTTNTTATRVQQPQRYVVVEQRPAEPELRQLSESVRVVQSVPQVRHFKSRGSTTSSVRSGYIKRVYDSPNPTMDHNRMYIQQQQPRTASKRYIQKVQPRPKSQEIVMAYPSDVVVKNIEDVYRNRSLRMRAVPQARVASQYVQVSSRQSSASSVVGPPMEKVKEYIEETADTTVVQHQANDPEIRHAYENLQHQTYDPEIKHAYENLQHQAYDPEIRNVYENEDYTNELTAEKAASVRQESHIMVTKPAEVSVVENKYNNDDISPQGGEVIVIKADTDVYKSTRPEDNYRNSEETGMKIYNNKVYHIKSEGVASDGEGNEGLRYTVVENVQPRDVSEDGLWESYAQRPDDNAAKEILEKQEAYRYHEDDSQSSDSSGRKKEEKRVHYMEDIEQTINDLNQEGDEENVRKELEEITDRDFSGEVDKDDDYVLDEEELAAFNREPYLVVIDKED